MDPADELSSPHFRSMHLKSPLEPVNEGQPLAPGLSHFFQFSSSSTSPSGSDRLSAVEMSLQEGDSEDDDSSADENEDSGSFIVKAAKLPISRSRPAKLNVLTPPGPPAIPLNVAFSTRSLQLPPLCPPLSSASRGRRPRSATEDQLAADMKLGFFHGADDLERTFSSCSYSSSPLPSPALSSPALSSASPSSGVSNSFKRPRDVFSPPRSCASACPPDADIAPLCVDIGLCNEGVPALECVEPATPACPGPELEECPHSTGEDGPARLLPICGFQSEQICITGETVSGCVLLFAGVLCAVSCVSAFWQLGRLLSGAFDESVGKLVIIDCRFDYEFEGGHIRGASSINDPDGLVDLFAPELLQQYSAVLNPGTADAPARRMGVIFHCEFSQSRGPKM